MKKKVLFLVSGNGGNLKAFDRYIHEAGLNNFIEIICVSDRKCGAGAYCCEQGIEFLQLEYTKDSPMNLRSFLENLKPDLIITNWNKIIDEDTVNCYQGKFINLHYSLLPMYEGFIGVKPIDLAFSKSRFIGVTTHEVDEGVDTGPVLTQSIYENRYTIQESYEKSFQSGVMMLISDIFLKLKINSGERLFEYNEVRFFPSINVDISIFSDFFWSKLK
ncbi:formyltransferase family protein [Vibrio nereis]|uniref:formyltransferase family protein n=1 Tax=Vibrio nereis TaxID=693 RepID=UPI002494A5D7|nr:formyltransferase family protein [Vibrio nereis]